MSLAHFNTFSWESFSASPKVALNSWYVGCCFTPLGLQLGVVQWLPFSRASLVGRIQNHGIPLKVLGEDSSTLKNARLKSPLFFSK